MLEKTIYETIGESGLWFAAIKSTPLWALPALPLTIGKYRSMMRKSSNLSQFYDLHAQEYAASALWQIARPRFHATQQYLLDHGIE